MKEHSGMSTYETTIEVDVTDENGHETGKTALVWLMIMKEVDHNYGADADGRRGQLRVEYFIVKSWIDAPDLVDLNAGEAVRCILEAEARFKQSNKHFQ